MTEKHKFIDGDLVNWCAYGMKVNPVSREIDETNACSESRDHLIHSEPGTAAERPEQTAIPELAISADDKFRAATLKNMHALDRSGIIAAYKELAASYYCRERQLLTACNNYEALKESHAELIEAVYGLMNLFNDSSGFYIDKLKSPLTSKDQDKIDDAFGVASIALANPNKITEGL